MYLLDTCAISDFVEGDENTLKRIKSVSPALISISISSINYMEIPYGLQRYPQKAQNIEPILHAFFQVINILDFSKKDANKAAEIRYKLQEKGTPIGPYNVLIAGVALNRNLTLITSNTREFERVEALNLEDWW